MLLHALTQLVKTKISALRKEKRQRRKYQKQTYIGVYPTARGRKKKQQNQNIQHTVITEHISLLYLNFGALRRFSFAFGKKGP